MNSYLSLLMKIHIHPLLWGVFIIGIFTATIKPLMILFVIILIHELGHAFAAHHFSWRIKRIMLLPFGGVAEVDEHGNRPLREELIVTISGPIQHIWLVGGAYLFAELGWIQAETYEQFLYQNALIFFFNLLPIWPLDGGKILFLWCSRYAPFLKAHERMLKLSSGFLVALCLYTAIVYSMHLHLWIVLAFLILCHYQEWRNRHFVYMRFLLERYHGKERAIATLQPVNASANEQIYDVLKKFKRGCKHMIVFQANGEALRIDENELLHAYFVEKRVDSSLNELVSIY
ncbi:M50 family metallopeptidase [Priestia flexa]|uniref:M50 family metallopeptidase n=1 Tax=Priestia flexa TaxID=86664 RepID=UPI0039B3EB4C